MQRLYHPKIDCRAVGEFNIASDRRYHTAVNFDGAAVKLNFIDVKVDGSPVKVNIAGVKVRGATVEVNIANVKVYGAVVKLNFTLCEIILEFRQNSVPATQSKASPSRGFWFLPSAETLS